jgi:DNA-binding NarL/FixJ family response regulator
LKLIADGLSNKQIGEQLCLSEQTIKNRVRGIYTKLGVSTRVQATLIYLNDKDNNI